MTSRPIVWVQWVDAHDIGAGTWITVEPPYGLTVESVGFLVDEDTDFLVISHSHCEGEWRGAFAIPKVGIVHRYPEAP